MVQTRIEVFPDIQGLIAFFETLPEYDTAIVRAQEDENDQRECAGGAERCLPLLEAQEEYSNDALYQML